MPTLINTVKGETPSALCHPYLASAHALYCPGSGKATACAGSSVHCTQAGMIGYVAHGILSECA